MAIMLGRVRLTQIVDGNWRLKPAKWGLIFARYCYVRGQQPQASVGRRSSSLGLALSLCSRSGVV
jgi:hypothetical protein